MLWSSGGGGGTSTSTFMHAAAECTMHARHLIRIEDHITRVKRHRFNLLILISHRAMRKPLLFRRHSLRPKWRGRVKFYPSRRLADATLRLIFFSFHRKHRVTWRPWSNKAEDRLRAIGFYAKPRELWFSNFVENFPNNFLLRTSQIALVLRTIWRGCVTLRTAVSCATMAAVFETHRPSTAPATYFQIQLIIIIIILWVPPYPNNWY